MYLMDIMISERTQTAKEYILYDFNYIKVRNSEIICWDRSPNSGNLRVGKYRLGNVIPRD